MGSKNFFDRDKFAENDKTAEKRVNMVAKILGNSKEALDIQQKFRKMAEVPQEEFKLKSFKLLADDLRNNMRKPAEIYK